MNRRRITVALGAAALSLTAACSSGGGNVTLHGTFTDSGDTDGSAGACADQGTLEGAAVTVSVDNVSAGSGTVNWTGNPVAAGQFLSGGTAYECSGTWSVTVPAAHIGYQLAVTGLGGVTGSVTLPVANAGSPVVLDDNLSNDNGGNALEISSNS